MYKKSLVIILTMLLFCVTVNTYAENTILILGDGLSSGHGIPKDKDWVTLLDKRLNKKGQCYEVINASDNEATTNHGVVHLPQLLTEHKPQIVMIELGGKDGLTQLPLVMMQKNLSHMIGLAQQAKAQVVLVAVRMPLHIDSKYAQDHHDVFDVLAKEYKIIYIPFFLQHVGGKQEYMQKDGIHPNEKAQKLILNNVMLSLKPLLKPCAKLEGKSKHKRT